MEVVARPLIPIEGHLVVIAVSMKNSGFELMASHLERVPSSSSTPAAFPRNSAKCKDLFVWCEKD
jgi:hypothetical protein